MQVVFEMLEGDESCVYIVDVRKIDDRTLYGLCRGDMREFPIEAIRNATTVSGRPFSLRPYDACIKVAQG